jgi:hypothetical protein
MDLGGQCPAQRRVVVHTLLCEGAEQHARRGLDPAVVLDPASVEGPVRGVLGRAGAGGAR